MRGTRRWIGGALLAPVLLLSQACEDGVGPEPTQITELPRPLTTVERSVITHSNAFGLELLGRVAGADDRPNVVLSPLSASMALGMTLNGADGATFDGMRGALGFTGMSQEDINAAYTGLIELLTGLDPDVRFDIGNALFANEDFPFHQTFLDAVVAAFDAEVQTRDFDDPATLAAINAWVSENTEGLIEKILDTLDPELVLLLLNAIYFDGAWTTSFDPDDTRRGAFRLDDDSPVEVDFMTLADVELPLSQGIDHSAVELPYGGQAFSMVVVVPHTETAKDFAAGLDVAAWNAIVGGLRPVEVDQVTIPKFTLSYDTYLNEPLMDMGMDVAFRPGADFTRMSPRGGQLCIDFVRQKTFIEVDERGTRAAAVTAVGIRPTSFIGLAANRSFVFAIRERLSGTILFTGVVGDPTAEDPGAEPFEVTCR